MSYRGIDRIQTREELDKHESFLFPPDNLLVVEAEMKPDEDPYNFLTRIDQVVLGEIMGMRTEEGLDKNFTMHSINTFKDGDKVFARIAVFREPYVLSEEGSQ